MPIPKKISDSCQSKLDEIDHELAVSKNTINILENKLDKSEAELFKKSKLFMSQRVIFQDEIKLFKDTINKNNIEKSSQIQGLKALNLAKKSIKVIEK